MKDEREEIDDTEEQEDIDIDVEGQGEEPELGLEGVEVAGLFATLMEKVTITFRIAGTTKDSTATLQPMSADAMARYRDQVARFSGEEGSNKLHWEPNHADADLALLMGTVVGMKLFYIKPDKRHGQIEEQYPFPRDSYAKTAFFKQMVPDLRKRLVAECKKVNGLAKK